MEWDNTGLTDQIVSGAPKESLHSILDLPQKGSLRENTAILMRRLISKYSPNIKLALSPAMTYTDVPRYLSSMRSQGEFIGPVHLPNHVALAWYFPSRGDTAPHFWDPSGTNNGTMRQRVNEKDIFGRIQGGPTCSAWVVAKAGDLLSGANRLADAVDIPDGDPGPYKYAHSTPEERAKTTWTPAAIRGGEQLLSNERVLVDALIEEFYPDEDVETLTSELAKLNLGGARWRKHIYASRAKRLLC